MSTGLYVHVTGEAELEHDLDGLARYAAEPVDALDEIATEGGRILRSVMPKRSGRMAGSVNTRRTANGVGIAVGVVYAGPINYGWQARNIAPRNFLRAADDVISERSVEILDADLDHQIHRRGLA